MVKWVFSILQNTWKYSVYADNRKLDIKFIQNKIYKVSRLYHFKEKRFEAGHEKSRLSPDWFGVDQQMHPFLFESKGTVKKKIALQTINHAANQLSNVRIITDTLSNKQYCITNKHIICSCFDLCNNVDKVWCIHDIDPIESEEDKFYINIDEECFLYYDAFIKYVESLEADCEPMLIDKQDYCCWVYDNERYCILGTIYNLVKSEEYNEKNKYRNFNDSVNKELSKIKNLEQILPDASSYEDGIIICNPNIKPDNNWAVNGKIFCNMHCLRLNWFIWYQDGLTILLILARPKILWRSHEIPVSPGKFCQSWPDLSWYSDLIEYFIPFCKFSKSIS